MKIYLPSNGKLKFNSVQMNAPSIGALRIIPNLSQIEHYAKNEFLRTLLEKPEQLEELTICDRDYLFLLAVGGINLNKISGSYNCKCGKKVSFDFNLDTAIATFLEKDDRLKIQKQINKNKYTFQTLLVKDETVATEYALEDEKNYEERFEFAKVILTLGQKLDDKGMEWLQKQDMSIYYAAKFFEQCMFHGIEPFQLTTCVHCQKQTLVHVPVVKTLLQVNISVIMSRFASLAKSVDFNSFCSLTIPELNTLMQNLTNQHK